jgi:nucleotide-binding universal stress UspA family protein
MIGNGGLASCGSGGEAMYRKVLLAYDGSAEGRRALREGARLAQICGADVFLFAVVNLSAGVMLAEGAGSGAANYQQEAYEEILAEGVRRLKGMGFSPTARLGIGDPAEQIGAVAREIGADLVVVGHRPQGTLSRWWSGSVAAHLMDHVGCSLLVSRKEISDEVFFSEMQADSGERRTPPPGAA